MTNEELLKLSRFDPVTYVPDHAQGNAGHEDCEQGVLIGFRPNSLSPGYVKVLFCKSRTIQTCRYENLVTG